MSPLLIWLRQPVARDLAMTLVHFLWQGTALAAATALLLWLLKGSTSQVRYAVACASMVLMALLPPFTFREISRAPVAALSTVSFQASAPSPTALAVPPAPGHGWRIQARRALDHSMPFALLAWMGGVLLLSTRLTGGWAWLQFLRRARDTVSASDEQQLFLLRLCQRMKLLSNIRLMRCDRVEGPTVLGWLKPVVLVPGAALTGLCPAELEMVLAHELAHILRHDYAVNLFQSVIEVILFYHPAVWWISSRIRQERELCCDDLALRHSGDALSYAQALTRLESLRLAQDRSSPSPQPVLALGAHGGSFMHRIQRLISPTVPTLVAPRAGVILLLLLGCAFAIQARMAPLSQDPPPMQAEVRPLKGAIQLRRYDRDSTDGRRKAGHIDLHSHSVSAAAMEEAITTLQGLPPDPTRGFVELTMNPGPPRPDVRRLSFLFQGGEPARIRDIVRAWDTFPHIQEGDKKPGVVIIQRLNNFTPEFGLVPQGLNVTVWAAAVPADLVLQALTDLEAMTPVAGIPQELRRSIPEGAGKGSRISMNLENANPNDVRTILENELRK